MSEKQQKTRRRGIFPVRSLTDLILKLLITMYLIIADVGIFYLIVIQLGLFPWIVPQTIVLSFLIIVFLLLGIFVLWVIWVKPSGAAVSS